jgi:predicted chitinase
VTLTIREKEPVVVAENANVPVMEAKENGARLTELKAVFKNGIAKVKVKLRPESDDDLKVWRDKLSGVKDGTFTYTFGGNNDTSDKDKKASIAEAIVQNSKDELAKDKKFAKNNTVTAALSKSSYNKGDTVTFDAFKSVEELWWIHAECTGKEEIEADFLKKDGKYFKIGGGCPRCKADITEEEFTEMFDASSLFDKGTNNIHGTTIQNFINSLNKMFREFGINTCRRKAYFLAQVARETGNFSRIDENLYYTTESQLHVFWSKESHPNLYSSPNTYLKNPEKLGNYVYRNIDENGDISTGDGYKYRGRGLMQITRKKGYRRFGKYSNIDLVCDPDILLNNLDLMIRSAGWFWVHGKLTKTSEEINLNFKADAEDFARITKLVHGTENDLTEREKILNDKIKPVLKTEECQQDQQLDFDIEYHIYSTGEIKYKKNNEERKRVKYFYYDSTENKHDLGTYDLNKVKDNYGGLYKDKLGDNAYVYLININKIKKYSKGTIRFSLKINTTKRFYLNDVSMASLFGAILENGYTDHVFNGFSNKNGESVGGSHSHKNGMNGDLRYLRKDKSGNMVVLNQSSETGNPCGWKGMDEIRQNNFNDALYKFGWKSMLSWKYNNNKLLNHTTHYDGHNDHLHVQGYNPTLIEIQ